MIGWLLLGGPIVVVFLALAVAVARQGPTGWSWGSASPLLLFAGCVTVLTVGRVALLWVGTDRRVARYAAAEADFRRRRAELLGGGEDAGAG